MRAETCEFAAFPPEELLSWTPRQREVLALLAEGHTNAEIADALGVSLDGAKWHVREIMSKLGAQSRQEAADYWRWRNGLPTRLRRRARLLAFPFAWRWVLGIVGGTAVAAIVVAFAVLVAVTRDGGGTPAEPKPAVPGTATATAPEDDDAGSEPATVVPSATSVAPPSVSPVASASVDDAGDVLTEIDGVPVRELAVAPVASLPAQAVVYYADTCAVCLEAPLSRALVAADGTVTKEALLSSNDPRFPAGYPMDMVHDGASRFAVAWCASEPLGPCGKHNPNWGQITPALLMSEDGGVTWSEVGALPPMSRLIGYQDGQVVVVVPPSDPGAADGSQYVLYPSRTAVEPVQTPALVRNIPVGDGTTLVVDSALDTEAPLATPESTYLWRSVDGERSSDYLVFPGGQLTVAGALSPGLFVGYASRNAKSILNIEPHTEWGAFDRRMVLIDLEARTVAPVSGFEPADITSIVGPLAAFMGPVLEVAADGDCLNVRREPADGAEVLSCYADGVLLRDGAAAREVGDTTWLAVVTPDGREGWASAAYLVSPSTS